MKKLLLTITAVFAIGFASAQIKTNAGTFTKPVKGDILAEINFYPSFNGDNDFFDESEVAGNNDVTGIKLRKFVSDKKAYRATVDLVMDSYKEDNDWKYNGFYLGIAAGVENHLKGAERLSTYWGYEGVIEFDTWTDKYKNNGTWYKDEKDTSFGLGANAFLGVDYYVMPNIYLGVEASYGFMYHTSKEVNYYNDENDSDTYKYNEFDLQDRLTSTFRLGWKF